MRLSIVLFFLTGLVWVVASARPSVDECHSMGDFDQKSEKSLLSAEFLGVKFRSGRPFAGESFQDAMEDLGEEQERRLKIDAEGLRRIPGVRVEIIGFTDDRECSSRKRCRMISLRRAKLVYDWFVAHGVPADKLKEPEGYGSEMAIDSNETEEGRQQNRRVEVNMIAP